MSSAALLAFGAGASAVGAAWECVALAQHAELVRRARELLAPLRA
ncbi:MAG: hypothetical protein JWO90_155, partial [Solirubrobacterales bacterium]|nr:hypothetical protein [Solirubrobacterales bacterium]